MHTPKELGTNVTALDAAAATRARGTALLPPALSSLADSVTESQLCRVHVLAWRDLDDPEAGGSELHAHEVVRRWAAAGLDVTMRTAAAAGHRAHALRNGYSVVRKAGRYSVFPRTALSGAVGRTGPRDGLVEIWNGMPFFSPLWAHCPRIVFLHHVHGEMWRMVLPPRLAKLGEMLEFRAAPPVYRRTRIVTLSQSSKDEIVDLLHLPPHNITVSPPGIDLRYSPGGTRSLAPLILAVGRLVPVKRFDRLIESAVPLKARHPGLELVIIGEGYERETLESLIRRRHAADWISLPGRVDDDELLNLYRRAWVVTSSSAREGWGMTLTEAAACGTPAVASRIAGHLDAVDDGASGLLVDTAVGMTRALDTVLSDQALRARLSEGALVNAARFTWDATATLTFEILAAEAARRHARRR